MSGRGVSRIGSSESRMLRAGAAAEAGGGALAGNVQPISSSNQPMRRSSSAASAAPSPLSVDEKKAHAAQEANAPVYTHDVSHQGVGV